MKEQTTQKKNCNAVCIGLCCWVAAAAGAAPISSFLALASADFFPVFDFSYSFCLSVSQIISFVFCRIE